MFEHPKAQENLALLIITTSCVSQPTFLSNVCFDNASSGNLGLPRNVHAYFFDQKRKHHKSSKDKAVINTILASFNTQSV